MIFVESSSGLRQRLCALLPIVFALGFVSCGGAVYHYSVDDVLDSVGAERGLVVMTGEGSGDLAIDVASQTQILVYVQLTDESDVAKIRQRADAAGLLGIRVFVDRGGMEHIHLADNLADAVFVTDTRNAPSDDEILRVMHPNGNAYKGPVQFVKKPPEGIDDWSHPYHGPDNNPRSLDTVARAPYLTQFLAEPYYAPLPQVTVTSAGRVFRATGHIAFKPREEPLLNTLTAYNGYNGTVLWQRKLESDVMIHRNTMIATPLKLFLGNDEACEIIDAVTGELTDTIVASADVTDGSFWKWMAFEDGTLYALIGGEEYRDSVECKNWEGHGWPWDPLTRGFNMEENPWGFASTMIAIDPETKQVLWHHREDLEIDSRAMAMKNGRVYLFRFGSYLTCLDAGNGEVIWKRTAESDPSLFAALGKNLNRQDWRTNWRTTAYLKCSDDALYFAGPMMDKLVVLSTVDGRLLWIHPYDNYQLVLNEDILYGISGPWSDKQSRKFDTLTGEVLGEFDLARRACTRPTASADAIFFRANGGSVRFDLATDKPHYVSPMRPDCFDGVTIANGLLYWWPSVCDCQLTLYGTTCLGPAGDFDFMTMATDEKRLESYMTLSSDAAVFTPTDVDWPKLRSGNTCTSATSATLDESGSRIWEYIPGHATDTTPPVTVSNRVFIGDSRGIVHALDSGTGTEVWRAYTGGSIRISPTVWEGRVYAGSGDGWVYCLDAANGEMIWRFRAAPVERKIPVYGSLMSTWPAASGVLVEDGVAYVAAGISNFDNIYVYALDARSGEIVWQNNTSGHLNREARTGAGVQGHMLLHDGVLYLAGGNAVSPAMYDIRDGTCLNDGSKLNICESICLRGWELNLIGDKVAVGGQPFYGDPAHPVVDQTVFHKALYVPGSDRDILWMDGSVVRSYDPLDRKILNASVRERDYPGHYVIPTWGKLDISNSPHWEFPCPDSRAVAVCPNAVVVAGDETVCSLDPDSGKVIWSYDLPARPVSWGLAVTRDGKAVLTLDDGRVLCLGSR